MAINYPGPWEIRMDYTVDQGGVELAHQARWSFEANNVGQVGDPVSDWFPVTRAGGETSPLHTQMNTWTDLIQDWYGNTMTMSGYDLVKYDVGSFNSTWYSADTINKTGTGILTNGEYTEQILVWRTTQGGIFRCTFEQGPEAKGDRQLLPLTESTLDLIADHIQQSGNWFVGRDGGYPIKFLGMLPGDNEATFKRRHRN